VSAKHFKFSGNYLVKLTIPGRLFLSTVICESNMKIRELFVVNLKFSILVSKLATEKERKSYGL